MGNRVLSKKHLTKESRNILKLFDHNTEETNSAWRQKIKVSLNPTPIIPAPQEKLRYEIPQRLSGVTHSLVLYLQVPIIQ